MEGLKTGGRKAGRPTKYDPIYCDMVEEEMAGGLSLTGFRRNHWRCKIHHQ